MAHCDVSVIKESDLKLAAEKAAKVTKKEEDRIAAREDMNTVIFHINNALQNLQIGLGIEKRQFIEKDLEYYWVLFNSKDDELSRLAHDLDDKESKVWKSILSMLAESPEGNFSYHDFELVSDCIVKDRDEFLSRLILEKWIIEEDSKVYTAGVRTLVELKDILRSQGAQTCALNGYVVLNTKGYREWAQIS